MKNQQSQSQQQSYAIISVSEPVLQKHAIQNAPAYTTYLIAGRDPHGEFYMRRRFREFFLLRNKLVERFVGIYIPPIPSKRAQVLQRFGQNTDDRFIQQRRKFLDYFCQKISKKPYIFDSDIFQTFIRGDPDFQRAVRFIPTNQYALITNIYDIQFKQAAAEADMPKVLIFLQTQTNNLKFLQKKFTNLRKQVLDAIQAKKIFVNQYGQCFRNFLPRFEQEVLTRHTSSIDNFAFSLNQTYKEKLSQYLHFAEGNPLYEYADALDYDVREVRAFLEAIESRKILQTKKVNYQSVRRQSKNELQTLKAGKVSLKSFFMSGNKQEQIKQLENFIPQYQKNETFVSSCLPLSAIAIYQQLQAYKKARNINFFINLSRASQKQIQLMAHYGQMIKSILEKPQYKSQGFSINSNESSANQEGKQQSQVTN